LDALLAFVAPEGGGIKKVKQLVDAAKTLPGSIYESERWWEQAFRAFGLEDEGERNAVVDKVKADVPPAGAREPGSPQPGSSRPDWLADLYRERDSVERRQDQLREILRQNQDRRTANQEQLQALLRRLEGLRGRRAEESIAAEVALAIMESPKVRHLAPVILRNILTRVGAVVESAPPTIVTEGLTGRVVEALQKTPGYMSALVGDITESLGKMRETMAYPNYAREKHGEMQQQANNERAAKLAVMILTDMVKKKLATKLAEVDMTPQQILRDFAEWKKLEERNEAVRAADGGISKVSPLAPEEQKRYVAIRTRLKKAFKLLRRATTTPFDTSLKTTVPPPATMGPAERGIIPPAMKS
jgi:hypothetical protein